VTQLRSQDTPKPWDIVAIPLSDLALLSPRRNLKLDSLLVFPSLTSLFFCRGCMQC
jgi:hypothetical protein